jgi:hypothetical protein
MFLPINSYILCLMIALSLYMSCGGRRPRARGTASAAGNSTLGREVKPIKINADAGLKEKSKGLEELRVAAS